MSAYQPFDVAAALRALEQRPGLSQLSQKSQAVPDKSRQRLGGEETGAAWSDPAPADPPAAGGAGDQVMAGFTAQERDLYEERAAIMEFDGGLSRAQAESLARECVVRARTEWPENAGPF